MSATAYLQRLQEEVGPRRAGSPGEGAAQVWLTARCRELGLAVESDPFTFIGPENFRPLSNLFMLAWLIGSIALSVSGKTVLGAVGFGLYLGNIFFFQKWLELRLARTLSQNILAGLKRPLSDYVAASQKGPALLLCAHYDTPRNLPPWAHRLQGVYAYIMPLGIIGLLFLGFYLLFVLLNVIGWHWVKPAADFSGRAALILNLPFILAMLLMNLSALFWPRSDSPGADDNGSGTALVVEVARRLKTNPPSNLEVYFAWWGAEERGLFGSRQFVRRFSAQLLKDRFYLLNADCVGVGEKLTVHTGQGLLRRKPADQEALARIERLAARFDIQTIRLWETILSGGTSDHSAWIDRGFTRAVSLLRENQARLSPPARFLAWLLRIPDANQLELLHIHSENDHLAGIRPEILEKTADLAEAYIREVDASLAAGPIVEVKE